MAEPTISIIVPVYKTEEYLEKCVDSILAQTFRDFELLLIDDGSPDNCPALCEEAAARDPRIRVIHQKNAGLSAARNTGVEAARGEWIGFVDSDDSIAPEMYETLLTYARRDRLPKEKAWCLSPVKWRSYRWCATAFCCYSTVRSRRSFTLRSMWMS